MVLLALAVLQMCHADGVAGSGSVTNQLIAMILELGHYKHDKHVHVLPLGAAADVVLGIPWFQSLRKLKCDTLTHHQVGAPAQGSGG